jgi:deoxyribodipyrimidine photo-lyase
MINIMWFREDLRIHDNTALRAAYHQAEDTLAIYILTPETFQNHHLSPCRIEFMLRGLNVLREKLKTFNIPLMIFSCPTFKDIPEIFNGLRQTFKIQQVFANRQYEVNEQARDTQIKNCLATYHIPFHCFDDQTIIPPDLIKTQQGQTYTVFTPYKKAWFEAYHKHNYRSQSLHQKSQTIDITHFSHPYYLNEIPQSLSNKKSGIDPALWVAGEDIALQRLNHFVANNITCYKEKRDYPAMDNTSILSPYLATGMISPRICLEAALHANEGKLSGGDAGIDCWISELIWREFYKSILVGFPRVCKNKPFKLSTDNIPWHDNDAHLQAWKTGQTGFPLVDAAMRQLNQTGWMHNRLRMLTAMFLTKLLFIDWRKGEQYFMENLIDGDFASNNGGWQWSASTGTDAAPYFRIFNPITQSEKFDSSGQFIRQYCPELSELDNKIIHHPYEYSSLLHGKLNYPKPIIDYKKAREYAITSMKAYL